MWLDDSLLMKSKLEPHRSSMPLLKELFCMVLDGGWGYSKRELLLIRLSQKEEKGVNLMWV